MPRTRRPSSLTSPFFSSPWYAVSSALSYGRQPLAARLLGVAAQVLRHDRGRWVHRRRRSGDDECAVAFRQVTGEAQFQQGGRRDRQGHPQGRFARDAGLLVQ
ncbi:hypothetical protein [Streptomyces sp. SID13726]|uniref:hypothetical protein n=1 Tax=Streptomyces sp. SID13726 TaxID=2706058 RepID=UPI001EF226CE|nr:hypothetical protein [Streptomyces sp. SID13726]